MSHVFIRHWAYISKYYGMLPVLYRYSVNIYQTNEFSMRNKIALILEILIMVPK